MREMSNAEDKDILSILVIPRETTTTFGIRNRVRQTHTASIESWLTYVCRLICVLCLVFTLVMRGRVAQAGYPLAFVFTNYSPKTLGEQRERERLSDIICLINIH